MFDIDKSVPAPPPGKTGAIKYPFRDMEIGDSILVDGSSASKHVCRAYNAAKQLQKRTGGEFRFTARKEGENKVRIWRVE